VDDDIDDVFAMRSDPTVMQFIREPQVNREDSVAWIKRLSALIEKSGIGFLAVTDKETDAFMGWCGLWILKETNEIEVGYALHQDYWGHGYASEAAKRVLEYAFNDLKLERIVAVAYPENKASVSVMEKLGMSCVGMGRFYDSDLIQYAITRRNFQKDS